MKDQWLNQVSHLHAQDAAWFFLFCVVLIAVCVWRDAKKEEGSSSAAQPKLPINSYTSRRFDSEL